MTHTIHVMNDRNGAPLADIEDASANVAVADAITAMVRKLTGDPRSAVHASIAGGRKTMGFFLGYALSLFGRRQDRLSHVPVSSPFESDHRFFYPPIAPRVLVIGGKPVRTDEARIMLAEIPFVRLRDGLADELARGDASFSEVIAAAQCAMAPPELVLDLDHCRIRAAGKTFRVSPARIALLAVFARRAQAGEPAVGAPVKFVADEAWARWYLNEYACIRGEMADMDKTEWALRAGMSGEYFSSQLSNLRRELKRELGPAAAPYLVDDSGTRPRRYRLALAPDAVRFEVLAMTPKQRPMEES